MLDKPKLGFFSASVGLWLDAEGGALVDRLLVDDQPRLGEVVDPTLSAPSSPWRAGESRHGRAVLALLMLELWLTRVRAAGVRDACGGRGGVMTHSRTRW